MLLQDPLILPCGVTLKNRLAKSAMSEILGTKEHAPSPELSTLYKTWAIGDSALLISGNVMIDRKALGEPRNVVIEDERHLPELKAWAKSVTDHGGHLWIQLNHPGKQSPSFLSAEPVAPSAIPMEGSLRKFFNTPRALTETEIFGIIERFATAAEIAKKAGFTGVQIHGAHGYLVSQFLSPRHNKRQDQWGGSLENRMRFVSAIYKRIREKVGNSFPISIKINSSDFQKDGLTKEDAFSVIKHLTILGMDLVEISGGSYEKPVMMGPQDASKYEAYFWDAAIELKKSLPTIIMLTGGFRKGQTMADALENKVCDIIGLARPLTIDPNLPKKLFINPQYVSQVKKLSTGIKSLDSLSMLNIIWYEQQISYLAQGKEPKENLSPLLAILKTFSSMGIEAFKKRRA